MIQHCPRLKKDNKTEWENQSAEVVVVGHLWGLFYGVLFCEKVQF
jgi:hypothetical protein